MHEHMLTRKQVYAAVAREAVPTRPPLMIRQWIGGDLYEEYGDPLREYVRTIPEDVLTAGFQGPGGWEGPEDAPHYRWAIFDRPEREGSQAIDSDCFMPDWGDLEVFLAEFPDPDREEYFAGAAEMRREHEDSYIAGMNFFCFYERLWTIRGMENLLRDFILEQDRLKKLIRAVRDYHLKVIRRFGEAGVDAVYTSDDMGTQTSLFFSPETFRSLLKPAYAALIEEAHGCGMHFWLHTCGNITEIMGDLIDIGLDVVHPIQPYAMDPAKTVERFGGRITFMPGIDVQHLLPHCSPKEVREGTREMIDTFYRPEGGFIVSLSNAIHTDTSLENIRAFMDASFEYGMERAGNHR